MADFIHIPRLSLFDSGVNDYDEAQREKSVNNRRQ